MRKILLFLTVMVFMITLTACSAPANDGSAQDSMEQESIDSNANFDAFKQIEIKNTGFALNGKYLYCAFEFYNPNDDLCVIFPSFRITARDEAGTLMGTDDYVGSAIYPGQTGYFAGQFFEVDQLPDDVEFSVLPAEDYAIESVDLIAHPVYKQLEVQNCALRDDRLLGEVVNPNDYDISDAAVTVIYKDADGKIIAGDTTYVSYIPASGNSSFEMPANQDFVTDSFDVYAQMRDWE